MKSHGFDLEPELLRALDEDGTEVTAVAAGITLEVRLRIYREMTRVRLLDAAMTALQRQGRVSFYGSATGQEAVAVGAAFGAEPEDWVFPALRESAIMLVRGFPLSRYLAQVFGTAKDVLKGRQMPSHMSSRAVAQVSWSSCIGTQLCHAVGAAWAARLRGEARAVVAFLGDGATSSSDFHAALNFAAVFRAGVVFVCQNNQWAISTPASRQSAVSVLARKAVAYAIPSLRVDGNDALAVAAALGMACQRARDGAGPTFIECVTYRMGAHSTSDDATRYRSEEEVRAWRERDPLLRLHRHLEAAKHWDPSLQRQLEHEIDAEIRAAIDAVERQAPPSRESLFDDVYQSLPWHLREQRDGLLAGPMAPRLASGLHGSQGAPAPEEAPRSL